MRGPVGGSSAADLTGSGVAWWQRELPTGRHGPGPGPGPGPGQGSGAKEPGLEFLGRSMLLWFSGSHCFHPTFVRVAGCPDHQ
jgi:hypothetical protein